jgi:hypothetical protein
MNSYEIKKVCARRQQIITKELKATATSPTRTTRQNNTTNNQHYINTHTKATKLDKSPAPFGSPINGSVKRRLSNEKRVKVTPQR